MFKHLKIQHVFEGTSKTIQNELLDVVLAVCQKKTEAKISTKDFVSLLRDETTGCLCKMALILRYKMKVE